MTRKIRKYLNNRVEGMSKYRAAVEAGYSHMTALTVKKKIESTKSFAELKERFIPRDVIFKVLKEGLNAMQVKVAAHEGKITDIKDFVDHQTRLKAADMALKVRGDYEAFKITTDVEHVEMPKEEVLERLRTIAETRGISIEKLCNMEGIDLGKLQ